MMSEDKKVGEDKRYAILSRESIRLFAEATGHADISDEVASILSEDVSYRLREATQNSCQFMRHAKRKKLTSEDFNKALRNSDVKPIFGYGAPDAIPLRQTREGEVWFQEEVDTDLSCIAFTSSSPQDPGQTTVKAHWLAVEGTQKGGTVTQGWQSKTNGKVPRTLSEDLLKYFDTITKAILGTDAEMMKLALSDLRTNSKVAPLLPYFVNFVSNGVKTVSYDVTQLTKLLHTVKSLITNQSLYLEPKPYLDLLVQGVMYCLLEPLSASINPLNDHWALRDYAARLLAQITQTSSSRVNELRPGIIQTLQDAFLDPAKPFCSHYGAVMGLTALSTQVAEEMLLSQLAAYWPRLQTVMEDISYTNAQAKADAHKVHGALLLMAEYVLLSHSLRLLEEQDNMESALEAVEGDTATGKEEVVELSLVNEPMLQDPTTSTPLKSDPKSPFDLPPVLDIQEDKTPCQKLNELYQQLYNYFGDSLAAKLPIHHVKNFYVPVKKEIFVSLGDSELEKTGEELLSVFLDVSDIIERTERSEELEVEEAKSEPSYEPMEDFDENMDEKSEKSEKSTHSSRSDRSDEHLPFLGDSDLTVKAISDPSRGIKLTISKRPRAKPPPEPKPDKSEKSEKSKDSKHGRRRKQSSRTTKEQEKPAVFECVPLIKDSSSSMSLVLKLKGPGSEESEADGRSESKRSRVSYSDVDVDSDKSEVRRLSLQMKAFGKRKTRKKSEERGPGSGHGNGQGHGASNSSNV